MLKENYKHIIFGGKMGLKMNVLHKVIDISYNSKGRKNVEGYELDKS